MKGELQRLEHEAQLAQSERGSVTGVGGKIASTIKITVWHRTGVT